MALDTLVISQLVDEFQNSIIDARIEKVYQPERDEILLNIRTKTKNFKLVISANASQPRVHFTDTIKENPQKAPMFCMLLRKHLQSGKIKAVSQVQFERIIQFQIESYDELGDLTTKFLICEIMGKHSNIILTKDDFTVIDSIKHIDFSVSSIRQILPGISYTMPPKQNKIPILSNDFNNSSFDFEKSSVTPYDAVMSKISGISPIITREILYKLNIDTKISSSSLTNTQKNEIINELKKLLTCKPMPCILYENNTNKAIDFCVFDIFQYQNVAKKEYFETLNEALDKFYQERDSFERIKQKSSDLIHLLNTNIERVSKKLTILSKTIKDAEKKDKYKIFGDLLTANLYKIKQGDTLVLVENFYDENLETVEISLNPQLTPSQNAQRYYKLYQKSKTAEIEAAKQFNDATRDLEYLESTLVLTKNSQSFQDLNAIRRELEVVGIIKKTRLKKEQKIISKPHHFISSDGFDIYVGKNNTQNDNLTLKFANSQDLWFHTKKIHGSHTIIKLGVNKDVPPQTIKEAATLSAYYSKGRDSSNVPVDYTEIKNVKKPNGAKPGMVIYEKYNTIYVNPELLPLEKIN